MEQDTIMTLDPVEESSQIDPGANSSSCGDVVSRDIPVSRLPKRSIIIPQPDAQPDLIFISQDENHKLEDLDTYYYEEEAGSGITVYLIDTGANPSHPEYTGMPGEVSWIWPYPHTIWTQDMGYHLQSDPVGHGSCMLSKIAGVEYGVAKKPNIMVVKMLTAKEHGFSLAEALKTLEIIMTDIVDRSLAGKSVICMGMGAKEADDRVHSINALLTLIQQLIEEDVVVVVPAGNDAVRCFSIFL